LDERRRTGELRIALVFARAHVHSRLRSSAVSLDRRRELPSHRRRRRHHGKLFDQLRCALRAGAGINLDQALDHFPQRRRDVRRGVGE
jgi:hypothetical protein